MWVKICGFTTLEEARAVAAEKIDAIGLNFYRQSSRYVAPANATQIAACFDDTISKVGVFVDSPPEQIRSIYETVPLDFIQLHGDYSIEDAIELRDLPIIWVHRMGKDGLTELKEELEQLKQADVKLSACLVDARVPGEWGGSGQKVDWSKLAAEYNFEDRPRLILAGGLVPENVAQAVQQVDPWGVDVASGVEQEGKKSLEKIQKFLRQAYRVLS